MKKSAWVSISTLVALSIVATGCGSSSSAPSNNNSQSGGTQTQNVDIANASGSIVWAANPITHTGTRQALADAFMKSHPNIKVTIQNQSNDSETNKASIATAIGGGAASPDVYMADVAWVDQMAASQMGVALDKYLPKSYFDGFASGLINGVTYKGSVYGVPFYADASFLFYRTDLLQKAGLSVPKSWEDVQSDALKLKSMGLVKDGFVFQGNSYEGTTCDFLEYLTDAGGSILDANGKPALNTPAANKALSFMTGLISSGASPKAVSTFQENDSMNDFAAGNAAFLRNWSYAWKNANDPKTSKVVGKVGVTTLPTFGGPNGYSTTGGWNVMVNPHSKNLAADLAFVQWIGSPEAQKILAEQYSMLPTNASVQKDPDVQKVSPVFGTLSQVKFVPRPTQSANYAQISQGVYQNVNKALSGGASASDALNNAQTQVGTAVSGNGGL